MADKKSKKKSKNEGIVGLIKLVGVSTKTYEGEIVGVSESNLTIRARKSGSRKCIVKIIPLSKVAAIKAESGASIEDCVGQEVVLVLRPEHTDIAIGKKSKGKAKFTIAEDGAFLVGQADESTVIVAADMAEVEAEDDAEEKPKKKGKKDKKKSKKDDKKKGKKSKKKDEAVIRV